MKKNRGRFDFKIFSDCKERKKLELKRLNHGFVKEPKKSQLDLISIF